MQHTQTQLTNNDCSHATGTRIKTGRGAALRRPHAHFLAALACVALMPVGWSGLQGQTVNEWTAGSGTDFNWQNGANWSEGQPTLGQDVVFGTPVLNPGMLPLAQFITLGAGSEAGSLWLRDDYTLSGGDLTLGGGVIRMDRGKVLQLESELGGSAGLTLVGGGTVRLGNAANSYTGVTSLQNGVLVIGDPGALGQEDSEILIGGSTIRGAGGGQLVLAGGYELGMILARDINLQGRGPYTLSGAALVSIGNNTITGSITTAEGGVTSALSSANGLLTLGNVHVNGTPVSTFTSIGHTNSAGVGNVRITGELSGTGSIERTGAGTLILEPTDSSGFTGTLRMSGGSVRVTSGDVFGTGFSSTTNSVLDFNAGQMEVRADSFATDKNLYFRSTSTSTTGNRIFVDHAIGSDAVNGTAHFGTLFTTSAATAAVRNFNSHNGYGMTFAGGLEIVAGNANLTLNNNLGGLLTFDGSMYNLNNGTVRTLIIQGNGNGLITGSILAAGAAHNFQKGGSGTLTVLGTDSTFTGNVNINGGMLAVTDFGSLNNSSSGVINIGVTGTTAGLSIGTTVTPLASGLETSRTINLAGTTGGARIHADQAGSNPVILNGNFTATGEGNKILTLGGVSEADNLINGIIPNGATSGTTSLYKTGTGTWVLGGANTYTGTTTVAGGTLKLVDTYDGGSRNLLGGGAVVFNIAGTSLLAGGVLEYMGAAGSPSAQSLGVLTPTGGMGTVRVTPGEDGSAALVFAGLGTVSGNAAINFEVAEGGSVVVTGQNGYNPNRFYVNGADFAFFDNGAVRAPVYGVDATFSPVNTLIEGNHGWLTQDMESNEILLQRSLKLEGDVTFTANAPFGLNDNAANTAGNILATGGNAVITGSGFLSGSGSGKLGIRVDGADDTLTIDLDLKGITGGFNKNGDGRLVLNGTDNTILGEIQVLGGELALGPDVRLGGDGAFGFNAMRVHGAVFDVGGNAVGVAALNGDGMITNNAAGAGTLTVGHMNGTGTWSGLFADGAGVLNVVKTGSGNQTWTSLNTYTGSTTIGGAGLVTVYELADIGQPSAIGAGDATDAASNAASLVFNGSTGGLVYSGAIVAGNFTAGSKSASTDRLFTLAGTGATLSGTASNNNAIVFSNYGDIVHGVVGPQNLILTGTSIGENRLNPRLTDSGEGENVTSVTKTGSGTWVLGNPDNSYTGFTNVENGRLALANAGSLPEGSPLVFSAPAGATTEVAVLQMDGLFDRALSDSPTPGTGTVTWGGGAGWSTTGGAGFAAHTDKLTVAIGGLGTETALVWGEGGFMMAPGALLFNSSMALGEVEWRNPIDLNGAARTLRVDDNGYTWTDFATLLGEISGNGGLIKTGSGTLRLLGDNTYTGGTSHTAGTLIVSSLGNSAEPGQATSVGSSTDAHLASNAITLGNGGTGAATLQYLGAGEVSDRLIRINTTTATNTIHADGSGPLILTNLVNDMNAGAKTLALRGSNTQGNMITSALTDNGGNLNLTIDGGASWILTNPDNSYSGNTTVSAGALGLGHDDALGNSTLVLNNGTVFAYGGDRIITNAVSHTNNTAPGFTGDHSITFTSPLALLAAANNPTTTSNFIVSGKALTFSNVTANAMTAARTWTINGSGHTVIEGDITTTTDFPLHLSYTGNGILTLGGANTTVAVSSGAGANTTVSHASGEGVLRLQDGGQLGTGNLTLSHGLVDVTASAADQSIVNLTLGTGASLYAELAIGAGRVFTVNGNVTYTLSSAATLNPDPARITGLGTLDFGSGDHNITVGNNTNSLVDFSWEMGTLTGSGTLTKLGTGTLDLTGITNNLFTGAWQISAGGILGLDGATGVNLILNGGVFEGSGLFVRALGSGTDEVRWNAGANGGFAASGGPLSVNIGGSLTPDTLLWDGDPFFVSGAGQLLFGSLSADDVTTFLNPIDLNGGVRTIQAVDNPGVPGDKAVLAGILSNGSINKTGNGIVELGADNELAGITVTAGTLQYSTASNSAGVFSHLGDANTTLTLSAGRLSYIGAGPITVQRPVLTTTANSTLAIGGAGNVEYSGLITASNTADGSQLILSADPDATGTGTLSGGVSMSGTTADMQVNGGDWIFSGAPVVIGDDFILITPATAVTPTTLTLAETNILRRTTGNNTDPFFAVRGNSILEIAADDPFGYLDASPGSALTSGQWPTWTGTTGTLRRLLVGADSVAGTTSIVNLNGNDLVIHRVDVGGIADGFTGIINGPGTLYVTGTNTDWSNGPLLRRGEINANMAGRAPIHKEGLGDFILSGDNSGLTGEVNARTRVSAGHLILDFTASNTIKIPTIRGLDLRGGALTLIGNDTEDTVQNVLDLALNANSSTATAMGYSVITLVSGDNGNHSVSLTLTSTGNSLQRNLSQGTLRINLPENGGIINNSTTVTNSSIHGLLRSNFANTAAYATVRTFEGDTWFAQTSAASITGMISTMENDVTAWTPGLHVTDGAGGFGGTVREADIHSLRFNDADGSALHIGAAGSLRIVSGGILVTDQVTGSGAGIYGGGLAPAQGIAEMVLFQDSPEPFTISSNISGAIGFTKTGEGDLILSGYNTNTGFTQIHAGTVFATGGNAIGDASVVGFGIGNSATLDLGADETIGGLTGGIATTGLTHLATVRIYDHTLTINHAGTATLTYSGGIEGTGTLVKTGGGNQTIAHPNSGFTGQVMVNEGILVLSGGSNGGFNQSPSITVNAGGELLDNQNQSSNQNRIGTAATIYLNNTAGLNFDGSANNRGLWMRIANNGSRADTYGTVMVNSGHNVIQTTNNNSTNASAVANMIITNFLRDNRATSLVKGTNLGAASGVRGLVRPATEPLGAVGGGGDPAQNVSDITIIPWLIGDNFDTLGAGEEAAVQALNGNTLVTWVSAAIGFRPLDINTQYELDAAGYNALPEASFANVRFAASPAGILDAGSKTINALVLDSTAEALAITGSPGDDLILRSGVLLAAGGNPVAFDGFSSLRTSSDELLVYVTDPAGRLTLDSAVTGNNALVKSGAGTLVLGNEANSYSGGTWFNQGYVEVSGFSALGYGGLHFHGGGLRWTEGADFDLSQRAVVLGAGGALFDTNGTHIAFANGIGGGGAGGFTKLGNGVLTLNGTADYSGPTRIEQGGVVLGAHNAVTGGDLSVAGGASLDLNGHVIHIGQLSATGAAAEITGAGAIVASGGFHFEFTGGMEIDAALSGPGGLQKTESGVLRLNGAVNLGGATRVEGGGLYLADSLTASLVAVSPGATLGGAGTITGDVMLGGTVGNAAILDTGLPGIDAGLEVLVINGELTLGASSLVNFILGQSHQTRLEVGTLAYVDPTAQFNFNLAPGYVPAPGSSFQVLSWNTWLEDGLTDWTAVGSTIFLPELPDGLSWILDDFSTQGIVRVSGDAEAIVILVDPVPTAVDLGEPATLSVVVAGSEPWLVQWVKDDEDIPGANGLEFTIAVTEWQDTGVYYARVTNGINEEESAAVTLTVRTEPIIDHPPQDVLVVSGQNYLFQVVASGPGPLEYVWKKDGEEIEGAPNLPNYLIENVSEEEHAGVYTVEISNEFGSVESDPAVLTVSGSVVITQQPAAQAVPEGNVAVFTVTAEGGGDLTYQWFRGVTPLEDGLSFTGTDTDTLEVLVSAATEGNYRVVVSGFGSQDTSANAALTMGPVQVVIDGQPESQIVPVGADFSLEVATSGGRPQSFQWRRGNANATGANVSGANTETLTVTGATLASGGVYTCRVSNRLPSGSSSATSAAAQVVVVDTASRRVVVRQGATSTLTANATGPVTGYQWFWDDGTGAQPVIGANARNYRLPNNLLAGRHLFHCRVSGFAGDVDAGVNEVLVYDSAPQIVETAGGSLPATVVSAWYEYQVQMAESEPGVEDATKAAARFTMRGGPRGLVIDNDGNITGRATVAGTFNVTITASNAIGPAAVVQMTLEVAELNASLIGEFSGPIDRHEELNGNLGGVINVKSTRTGAYTVRVTMGTSNHSAKGALATETDPLNPLTTITVNRGRLTPLTVTFRLNAADGTIEYADSGITSVDSAGQAKFRGWQSTWTRANPATAYAGYYTAGLNIRDEDSELIPQGTGYMRFTVNATTGRLTVSGRLADNSAFTTATYVGPQGQVLVFRTLYAASARGSVLGHFVIDPQSELDDPADNTITGVVNWRRPADPSPKQRVYKEGFHEDLAVVGARYLPPPNGVAVLDIDTSVVSPGTNAVVQMLDANVNDAALALPLVAGANPELGRVEVLVNGANKVSVPGVPVLDNPRKVSVTINRNTGLVTIKFRLSQPHPILGGRPATLTRNVTATALIVTDADGTQAIGFFLLPQLPAVAAQAANATPVLGGQALLLKK